jgi:hypothetical protein
LIASHAPLSGRGETCIDPAHRRALHRTRRADDEAPIVLRGAGDVVAHRPLDFYDALGRVMAVTGSA